MRDTYRALYHNLARVEQKLDNLLLYVDFFPNAHNLPAILMKDGAVVVLFRLAGIDYEGLSEDEKEQFSYYARTALEQLPDEGQGFTLSNLLIRDHARIEPLVTNDRANPVIRFVQEKKQAFWEEQATRSFAKQVVCALRYFDPQQVAPSWPTLISERKRFEFVHQAVAARVDKLYQAYLTFQAAFERFGFLAVDREEAFALLYRLINRADAPAYRPDLSLNAQLAHSHYCFSQDGRLTLNRDGHAALIGIKYPPAGTVALYLRRFYELDFPFVLKQSFGFPNKQKLWKRMDFYKNIAVSLSAVDKTCALYVDEAADFQRRVESDKELPVWWSFALALYADSGEELKVRTLKVANLLKEIGAAGIPERNNLKNGYFSLFPGHERFYLRHSLVATANVGDLLSAYTLSPGDRHPIEYFQDRTAGVFAYNPFTAREKAHHLCITGPTGSGKSFAVNKLLMSSLITDPTLYVVDLKRSFVEFFDFLRDEMPADTAVMSVGKDRTDFRFNPFLLADLEAPVPEPQMTFCLGLLKIMVGSAMADPDTEWAVRQGLELFFERYRVLLRNHADSAGGGIPPLTLLANTLERKTERRAVANALRLWTVGRKGEVFNTGVDSLRLAKYCYFDIADWEADPALMTALVYAIFAKIYGDVTDERKQKAPKYLFCDEAHLYLKQSPEMAYWIELLFRTGRHHNLLVGVVTQSIKDLVDESWPWSKGIVENIRQAFFFNGQKDVEEAFRAFQMSAYHVEQYYRLKPEHHEVLYWSAGGLRRILRPVTDRHTYWLATTDPAERAVRQQVKASCGGDVRRTIETLVRKTAGCASREKRLAALAAYLESRPVDAGRISMETPILIQEGHA
ncbi:MAG TPA: ATP-binding protein [Acidobacteriota bacterium]|nr:ATP-binding protein [Acidobacteriota bacterium]